MERRINYKNVVEGFNIFHNAVKECLGTAYPHKCWKVANALEKKVCKSFIHHFEHSGQRMDFDSGIYNFLKEDKREMSVEIWLRCCKPYSSEILKFSIYITDNGDIDYSFKARINNALDTFKDITIPIAYLLDEESFLDYILSNYNAKIDRNILTINY